MKAVSTRQRDALLLACFGVAFSVIYGVLRISLKVNACFG